MAQKTKFKQSPWKQRLKTEKKNKIKIQEEQKCSKYYQRNNIQKLSELKAIRSKGPAMTAKDNDGKKTHTNLHYYHDISKLKGYRANPKTFHDQAY